MPLTLPVAMPLRGRSLERHHQDRFHPPLVKKGWFSRPEAPSVDECPLGHGFRHDLEREPATVIGLGRPIPASERSFALRYDEEGLDAAASASSSLAGARCHAPLVDFCNRNVPQARLRFDKTPIRALAHRTFARRAILAKGSLLLSEPRSRVVTGQGPMSALACAAASWHLPPRLRASEASPQPDWLGHLLS